MSEKKEERNARIAKINDLLCDLNRKWDEYWDWKENTDILDLKKGYKESMTKIEAQMLRLHAEQTYLTSLNSIDEQEARKMVLISEKMDAKNV